MKITKLLNKRGDLKTFSVPKKEAKYLPNVNKNPGIFRFERGTEVSCYILHRDEVNPKDVIMTIEPIEVYDSDVQKVLDEIWEESSHMVGV